MMFMSMRILLTIITLISVLVNLCYAGRIDVSGLVSTSDIDHGTLSGNSDEDHSSYIEKDGGTTTTGRIDFAADILTDDCIYFVNTTNSFCMNVSTGVLTLTLGSITRQSWASSSGDTRI